MQVVIYARQTEEMSLYEQYNKCANFAKKYNYSISGKVLDFDGKHFHEAVNKVIADNNITALLLYSKSLVFPNHNDYLFYRIYFDKLNKKLLSLTE